MNRGLAAIAALVVVVSCSPSGGAPSAARPQPIRLELSSPTRLDLGGVYNVNGVTLGHDRLAFPFQAERTGNSNMVVSVDLRSRVRTVVAKSEFPDGLINFVAVSGDWTVYDDQSDVRGDGAMENLWRIVAINHKTQQRRILATSGKKENPFVPYVKSHNGYVYWAMAEPDRSARLLLWRPEWAEPRTVLRHAEANTLDLRVDGDWMIYVGQAADTRDSEGSDCWRVRLGGGTPESLTNSGLAMDCISGADRVTWTEHIDHATKNPPSDGILGNPYRLFTKEPGQESVLLNEGYFSYSQGELFGQYLVWDDMETTVITRLDDPTDQRTIEGERAIDPFFSEADRLGLAHYVDGRTVVDLYELAPH